jgi:hypothetical protein
MWLSTFVLIPVGMFLPTKRTIRSFQPGILLQNIPPLQRGCQKMRLNDKKINPAAA